MKKSKVACHLPTVSTRTEMRSDRLRGRVEVAYRGLDRLGYEHEISVLQGQEKDAAGKLLPRIHLVASLLKRWLMGAHQGAVTTRHLDYYLDEFTFRFSRRTSRSRGKLLYRLLQQAVQVDPAPYRMIVGGKDACHADHNL